MKRITHWQAAFAGVVGVSFAIASLLVYHHLVDQGMALQWMKTWNDDVSAGRHGPYAPSLEEYILCELIYDALFCTIVWLPIGVVLWKLLGRTNETAG
jgi:cytochrome b subunit of formate dehydrogenase